MIEQYPLDEVVRYDPDKGHGELVKNLPHYHKIDVGTGEAGDKAHLVWRRNLYELCRKSAKARQDMIEWCKEDACFFLASTCWLFEPRPGMGPTIRAFNLWDHQLEALAYIDKYLGLRTIGIEKSRGEGASWLVLTAFLHRWLFYPLQSFGVISKDEKTANDANNTDSLTYKFMWQLEEIGRHCPWLLPRGWDPSKHFSKTKGSITNPANRSMLNAWSAVGTAGTGGRKTAVMMDELAKFPRGDDDDVMASLQPVTDCRILVSTPYGDSGAYYNAMQAKKTEMLKIILHWPMNPDRRKGLYRWEKTEEKPRILDNRYPFPDDFRFVQDGKLRSPWYDKQANQPDMIANPRALAQEYDLDYGGSSVKFYQPHLREAIEPLVRSPYVIGEIDYDDCGTMGEWLDLPDGKCHVWMPIGNKRPPAGNYVVGVDVAAGLGGSSSSNSAIVVLDVDSGEQVFEWKDSMTPPAECAQLAVAVCKWLAVGGNPPLLVWEANGGGGTFTNEVINRQHYPNPYMRRTQTKHGEKKTKVPGYWTSDPTNYHERVRLLLQHGNITIRSRDLFDELGEFQYNGAKVEHAGSVLKEDAATGKAHGDIVSALGMAVIGLESLGGGGKKPEEREVTKKPPKGSFGERIRQYELQSKSKGRDWVDWN